MLLTRRFGFPFCVVCLSVVIAVCHMAGHATETRISCWSAISLGRSPKTIYDWMNKFLYVSSVQFSMIFPRCSASSCFQCFCKCTKYSRCTNMFLKVSPIIYEFTLPVCAYTLHLLFLYPKRFVFRNHSYSIFMCPQVLTFAPKRCFHKIVFIQSTTSRLQLQSVLKEDVVQTR